MQKIVKLNQAFLYCCMVVMFCLHSQGYAAPTQGKPVSITIKNSTLAEVLRQVSKKSGLYIYFQDADLAAHKNVTIDVRNKPVENVLHELLDGRGLSWVEVSENTIAVKKKLEVEDKRIEGDTVAMITVTGIVTNEKGDPIPGASVTIKNGKIGTITRDDGRFILKDIKSEAIIVISNISYLSQELPLKNKRYLNVKLKEFVGVLDETVVIAYGTTTRRLSTGNTATLKAKDIEKQPVGNPLLALQGRIPGLAIVQSSGISGSGVTVRIQGQNSIGNGNDPFYVVDGIPYSSQMLPTTNGPILGGSGSLLPSGSGNPLNYINPSDIESIDILKDADATSIYGSRAANGAILITTKKGKAGSSKVDINVQNGWGRITRMLDLMNTQQYLEMRHEALMNDQIASPSATDYDINGTWDTTRYTDWQKTLIGGTSRYSNIYGSVSGGSATTQYIVGANYHKETAVFPGNFSDQKGSLHFNLSSTSSNKKFKLQLSGNYLYDDNQLPSSDVTRQAIQLAPNAPALYSLDGSLNWEPNSAGISTWTNPLSYTLRKYQNKTTNLIGNLALSYEILPGLEIKSSFGYNNLATREFSGSPLSSVKPETAPLAVRTASYSNSSIGSWIIEPQINYKRIIGDGNLDFLAGSTIQQNNNNGESYSGEGYSSDEVLEDILSAAKITATSTIVSQYKYNAVFARLSYNWRNKYVVNTSIRRDGSSRFGSENQFHNFASVGVAWIFTEEELVKNGFPFLSFGKFRGSFGTTGSDQIQDYSTLNLYQPTNYGVGYQGGTGLVSNRLTNPYLKWEETKKLQLGVELGFFKDRILFTSNYVHNRSSNQLLEYNLPTITGFGTIQSNFPATVQNTAWEFALNTTNLRSNDFSWSTNLNLTIPKNKLVAFPDLDNSSYAGQIIIGQPLSVTRLFHFMGVDRETGVYLFTGQDGKPTATPDNILDRNIVVSTLPKFYGGMENSFEYKGFRLDVMFQFVNQKALGARFGISNSFPPGRRLLNVPASLTERWKERGDNTSIQRYSSRLDIYEQYNNATYSDGNYTGASFVRMKNIAFSYQLPQGIVNKLHLKNCRFYLQGQNLLTITNFSGIDPETLLLPPLKVLTVGLQVSL